MARHECPTPAEFESFVASNPDRANLLRQLFEDWNRANAVMRQATAAAWKVGSMRSSRDQPAEVGAGEAPELDALLERLKREDRTARYRAVSEVARGAMGSVLKVWDDELQRHSAMKVILEERAPSKEDASSNETLALVRFCEEAQVTGQLDHPGIVPVHEMGVGDDGRAYFTMRLVRGRDFREILELVNTGDSEWNQTRALGALLQVCDAVAYAHSKGVIHRDLKPANLMVGRFGEVYVMDWGLAKVSGRPDTRDLRMAMESTTWFTDVQTVRADKEGTEAPLSTMDGTVVGTPAYMAPEQARGDVEAIDRRSDVYALGAILYQLLTGHKPYVPSNGQVTAHTVLRWLLEGPPRPVADLNPRVQPELEAICEKAMSREPEQRYEHMGALAADLRAYLEGRVVAAYERGIWAELKKLVIRNKLAAGVTVVALVAIIGGMTGYSALLAAKNHDLTIARGDVLRLSAVQDLEELQQRAHGLWPATPDRIGQYTQWLRDSQVLLADMPTHRAALQRLRGRALEPRAADRELDRREHPRAAELERSKKELSFHIADSWLTPTLQPLQPSFIMRGFLTSSVGDIIELERVVRERWRWRFADREDEWQHEQLQAVVEGLEAIADPELGLIEGLSRDEGMGIRRRLALARDLEVRESLRTDLDRWQVARQEIRDSDRYRDLDLIPQRGLIPLGASPESGLQEFAVVQTGSIPERDGDGRLALDLESAVVLVLLPGGSFRMGAQSDSPGAANFVEDPLRLELPVRRMEVSPFFMGKHELTQAQWVRFSGANPSVQTSRMNVRGFSINEMHPVENINYEETVRVLGWMGLTIPTEAQWEYGARAGTATAWATGADPMSLLGFANIADETGAAAGTNWLERTEHPGFVDGHAVHAPVGTYAPNTFGLHDMHGNVWEWCHDEYAPYKRSVTNGDIPALGSPLGYRVIRGGAYYFPASYARSSRRYGNHPRIQLAFLGVRPVRELEL